MIGCVVMTTTAATKADAERLARALVNERLAACVQVTEATSFYVWDGALRAEPEAVLTIKTRAALQDALAARVRALHTYETPEIIATPIVFGDRAYLDWINEQTRNPAP
jgi:periplasmic divalent cation tolerance protein